MKEDVKKIAQMRWMGDIKGIQSRKKLPFHSWNIGLKDDHQEKVDLESCDEWPNESRQESQMKKNADRLTDGGKRGGWFLSKWKQITKDYYKSDFRQELFNCVVQSNEKLHS